MADKVLTRPAKVEEFTQEPEAFYESVDCKRGNLFSCEFLMWFLETLGCPWLQKLIFWGEEERWKIRGEHGREKGEESVRLTFHLPCF